MSARCRPTPGQVLVIFAAALPRFTRLQNLVDALNLVTRERLTGLAAAARAYAARMRGSGPMLLISDLMDPGYLDALRDLAGTRSQLSVLHLLAPDELEPEVPPDARLVDRETGHAVEVSGDDDLVERYRSRLADWQAEISSFVARRGGAYVLVPSDLDLADLLFDVLRRRRVVE